MHKEIHVCVCIDIAPSIWGRYYCIVALLKLSRMLFDETHQLRSSPLTSGKGKLVLIHDSQLYPNRSTKPQFRFSRPFRKAAMATFDLICLSWIELVQSAKQYYTEIV
jgi:hypothetical protein